MESSKLESIVCHEFKKKDDEHGKSHSANQNLCKIFQKQRAVNNVSISIHENSVYGLLGPNGAGKSTTLKMITDMFHKTSGEILFEGHPWSQGDLTDHQHFD